MTPQFKSAVETYGPRFMADLGLTRLQVGGIFGNLAVESDQFRALQEYKPTVNGSKGGWGWPQWTGYGKGGRRGMFESWADAHDVKRDDPEGFYRFMLVELRGTEKAALARLKRTTTLDTATEAFMKGYERPGTPHLDKRKAFALEALRVLDAKIGGTEVSPSPIAAPAPVVADSAVPGRWAEQALAAFEVRGVQNRLIALGYHDVGLVDGVWAPDGKVSTAIRQLQTRAVALGDKVSVDGHYGPETQDLLNERHGDRYRALVSEQRASTTASDLAKVGTPAVVQGRRIQWSSLVSLASTLAGVLMLASQNYQAGTDSLPWVVQATLNFLPPWAAMVAPAVLALYNAAVAKGLIGSAVERVREGIDNSGMPPASAAHSGLLGSLFGAR